MKRGLRFLAVALSGLFLLLQTGGVVHADVNDFVINDFSADYVLTRDDPQGELTITEKIELTFSDNNHGILRAIPQKYNGHSLKLDIISVTSPSRAPAQYETYTSNDNLVLKIGDPDKTVTGNQSYVIKYKVQNVIGFYEDHEELYWDINGDQWQQPFLKTSVRMELPPDLNLLVERCYTGAFGSTTSNCKITKDKNRVAIETTQPLSANQTLTSVVAFNKGYFTAPTWKDWLMDNISWIAMLSVPPLVVGAWVYRRWYKYGKDLKGTGVIVAQYDSPDKLTPAEAGTLLHYKLRDKDISATIIDLAIRKYIKIIETTQKKILKDKTTYELELLNADFSKLRDHEQKIMNAMFAGKPVGTKINLNDMTNKFYKTSQELQSSLPKQLTASGYFTSNPRTAGAKYYGLAFALIFIAFIIHTALGVGFGIAGIITLIFAYYMPKRSAKGVQTLEHLKGLELYLKTAESDRIKMQQSPNAPYAANAAEPVRTVELFEKLLPLAVLMGVEKEWAKQFEDIYKTAPDWYSGNWSSFNSAYLASNLSGATSAVNSSFASPSSSGSGGGGGSSGGGGGGGGGGGW